MGAAVGAGLFGLDANIAATTGGLAAEKNAFFIPLIMVGLAAYEAYETYDIYRKEGPVAALKHAGFALAVGVAGGAAVKVTAKVGGKFITKAYPSAEAAWRAVLADNPMLGRVASWVSEKGSHAFERVAAADAAASKAILEPVLKKFEKKQIANTWPNKYWKTRKDYTFHGQTNKVYQRDDLIDLARIDPDTGFTNAQLMRMKRAPIGPDNRPINVHHGDQTQASALFEMTERMHQKYYKTLHIWTDKSVSTTGRAEVLPKIDRGKFNKWRGEYWVKRLEEMESAK